MLHNIYQILLGIIAVAVIWGVFYVFIMFISKCSLWALQKHINAGRISDKFLVKMYQGSQQSKRMSHKIIMFLVFGFGALLLISANKRRSEFITQEMLRRGLTL